VSRPPGKYYAADRLVPAQSINQLTDEINVRWHMYLFLQTGQNCKNDRFCVEKQYWQAGKNGNDSKNGCFKPSRGLS
jgi:hypothetical protein